MAEFGADSPSQPRSRTNSDGFYQIGQDEIAKPKPAKWAGILHELSSSEEEIAQKSKIDVLDQQKK